VNLIVPEQLRQEEEDILDRIHRGETVEHYETIRRRKDGSTVDISLTVSPIFDTLGALIGASKVARDITERVRARERQAMLLQELNHRVKNTLLTVQSIASQTLNDAPDPQAFRETFQKRLAAMSRTHNLLSEGDWYGSPLRELALAEAEPYADGAERISIDGPAVKLNPSASLALGMAFHELATNAAKYGALSIPTGQVRIRWRVDDEDGERRLRLEWRESGGPAVAAPKRRGLGSRLIERGVAHQLNGAAQLNFESNGVYFVLEAPLASIEAPS
jgi:two-component system, chemotaxis family, CheB/CheR fusion protein